MQCCTLQTSYRTGITRRSFLRAAAATFLHRVSHAISGYTTREQSALTHALENTGAMATILDQRSGRVLGVHGNVEYADTPGSILKPLLLFAALQSNLVTATTTVFCRRDLRIGNQSYPCTHPQSGIVFSPQEALAYSCNTWFASLGLRFTPSRLTEALRGFHLHTAITPVLSEQKQLIALGLAGVTTTSSQVASAYQILSSQLGQPFGRLVADGLRDSVSFGMAHNAGTPGLEISGKTGTASGSPRRPWSHGWFAGFATIHGTPLVMSLYLPRGNGADAAELARNFFLNCAKTTA